MRGESNEIWINRNLSFNLTFRIEQYDYDLHKLVVALLFPTIRSIGSVSLCHTIFKASASVGAFFLTQTEQENEKSASKSS